MTAGRASETLEQQLADAIAFLRQVGRERDARAVEALLADRLSSPFPIEPLGPRDELVPIDEAARLIGTSRAGVRRRVERGTLAGAPGPPDGDGFVTRRSLARLLGSLRASERVAAPLGGVAGLDRATDAGVAQRFVRAIEERDRQEREERETEQPDGAARANRERRVGST